MLGRCELRSGSFSEEIEIEESADDVIVRYEVEYLNGSADDRHPVEDSCYDAAVSVNADSCSCESCICLLTHDEDFLASGVFAFCTAKRLDDGSD